VFCNNLFNLKTGCGIEPGAIEFLKPLAQLKPNHNIKRLNPVKSCMFSFKNVTSAINLYH